MEQWKSPLGLRDYTWSNFKVDTKNPVTRTELLCDPFFDGRKSIGFPGIITPTALSWYANLLFGWCLDLELQPGFDQHILVGVSENWRSFTGVIYEKE